MMNVLRRALVAATIAFSAEMAVADGLQDGLTAAQAGDYATSLEKWRPLADQGDAIAQYNLGGMYANGTGVFKDAAEAVRWFRLAADQGLTRAQGRLGLMYFEGSGVPSDIVTAHMWQNIANANGSEPAAGMRARLEQQMTPAEISEATRRARRCMASSYADCD